MRFFIIAASMLLVGMLLHAKPAPTPKKDEPKIEKKAAGFKPVEINDELNAGDPNDPKLNNPSKKYAVKLAKGKTYVIDMVSKDFDAYLRLLDKNGKQLDEDDDGGGDTNARIIYTTTESANFEIVATTFDGQLGKFNLQVREFVLKGEAKAREVGNGININDQIAMGDVSPLGKLGKVYSVQLKKGQTYTIDLEGQALDSYLYLFDAKNKLLAQDDDSGGGVNGLDSRIVFRADHDGVYHLLATSLDGAETGGFSLSVRKND